MMTRQVPDSDNTRPVTDWLTSALRASLIKVFMTFKPRNRLPCMPKQHLLFCGFAKKEITLDLTAVSHELLDPGSGNLLWKWNINIDVNMKNIVPVTVAARSKARILVTWILGQWVQIPLKA
jgi:hypothetical protein